MMQNPYQNIRDIADRLGNDYHVEIMIDNMGVIARVRNRVSGEARSKTVTWDEFEKAKFSIPDTFGHLVADAA